MEQESTYRRRFRLTLLIVALCAPALIYGAITSLRQMHTEPSTWVPNSFEERQQYEWFTRHFEREMAVIISWQGCTIDDPRLEQFEDVFASNVTDSNSEYRDLFERVITGLGVIRELESGALQHLPTVERRRRAAIRRLRGTLVGNDGSTSCAVVILSTEGGQRRMRAVELLREIAADECGIPEEQIYISGPPALAAAIDRESQATLLYFSAPCIILALVVCCFCLKSVRYTLTVVTTAALGQIIVLAVLHYVGIRMNAVLAVLPALVFVLTISAGIHLTNYYLDEVQNSVGGGSSVHSAMRVGWLPCVLAVATTVIGLCSLLFSKIVPIWQFGAIAAVGLVVAVTILFLVLPGVLATWPASSTEKKAGGCVWRSLHSAMNRWWMMIVVGCLVGMAVAGVGLFQVQTSADIRDLMTPGSRSMRDMQWLERNVGPLTPIEIILRFKSECPLTLLDRIELVDHVDDGLRRGVGRSLRGTMTALTFVRPIPTPAAYMRRSLIESRLQNENMLQRLMDGPYVAETDQGQAWRISLRVEVANDLNYGKYVTDLRRKVNALFRSKWTSKSNKTHRQRWKDGLESVDQIFTGGMPLADRAHRTLLRDLVVSFLTAFGMVTIVLMFALRSVVAGLVSMVPTVLPTILVFGTMGWLSARVDVGSVMTASVALGIAVDDLLHFLAWFQRESKKGASRSEAVRRSLRHCGRAMVQTTLICGLGLIVFALSDFVPAQRFAWMMLILLFGALVADLVLLPAILISPVGRCFVPKDARLRSSDE